MYFKKKENKVIFAKKVEVSAINFENNTVVLTFISEPGLTNIQLPSSAVKKLRESFKTILLDKEDIAALQNKGD